MKFLVFYIISLAVTALFLTIDWFTVWAWLGLSLILALAYDCFYISQENIAKITKALIDELRKEKDDYRGIDL